MSEIALHHGDCIKVMRTLPDNSVDSIVTDPPYGLGFMGKAWDTLPPGEDWARECLRVLKPGGYLLAFGGTRTWHRLAVAVEDAGFEIRDSIAWMHGQGFPKGKSQLKPAHEPIVVARKKTDAPRTGLFCIDASRIGVTGGSSQPSGLDRLNKANAGQGYRPSAYETGPVSPPAPAGRWPSNVILDEDMANVLDAHGGTASRFFYIAKPGKSERPTVGGIRHPTVKPLALMRYLVRLVTPAGGTVLEPFAGSGTTVEACILEAFDCIAIEREADYLPLIHTRMSRASQPGMVSLSQVD